MHPSLDINSKVPLQNMISTPTSYWNKTTVTIHVPRPSTIWGLGGWKGGGGVGLVQSLAPINFSCKATKCSWCKHSACYAALKNKNSEMDQQLKTCPLITGKLASYHRENTSLKRRSEGPSGSCKWSKVWGGKGERACYDDWTIHFSFPF